jgi:hypothetical protein
MDPMGRQGGTMNTDAWLQQKLYEELIPPQQEIDAVNTALMCVEQRLEGSGIFRVAERYRCGSFAKGTMLAGRKEADLVVVLADAPDDRTLQVLKQTLDGLAGLRHSLVHEKAVELNFEKGVHLDVLPVAKRGLTSEGPSIPRKLRRALSGPMHVQWFIENGHQSPIQNTVRLLKHFRDRYGWKDLSSFAIEVMAVDILRGFPGTGMASYFGEVLSRLADGYLNGRRLQDPASPGNDLVSDLTERDREDIAMAARRAVAMLKEGTMSAVFTGRQTMPPPSNLGGRTLA